MPTSEELPEDHIERSRRHAREVDAAIERARQNRARNAPYSSHTYRPPPTGFGHHPDPRWYARRVDRQDILAALMVCAVLFAVLARFS